MNRNKLVVQISMWNTLCTLFDWKHIFNTMSFYAAFSTLFTKAFVQNVTFTQEKSWENHFLCIFFNIFFYWIYFYNWRKKCSKVSIITCFTPTPSTLGRISSTIVLGQNHSTLGDFQTHNISPFVLLWKMSPVSNF